MVHGRGQSGFLGSILRRVPPADNGRMGVVDNP